MCAWCGTCGGLHRGAAASSLLGLHVRVVFPATPLLFLYPNTLHHIQNTEDTHTKRAHMYVYVGT